MNSPVPRPSPLSLSILHIDAHLLVIDKPAGLAVHPGPSTPRSLDDHLWSLREGFVRNPQPVHRLDRDTSGCLVLARHPKALKKLTQMFSAGLVGKTYWAVVDGAPAEDEGRIDAPLFKISSAEAGWRMIVDPRGKVSATRWRVLANDGARSLVEFSPETGRTHQVRVHAAALGCPILGDPVYGGGQGPMRLHARGVVVPYTAGAAPVTVVADVPEGWPLLPSPINGGG